MALLFASVRRGGGRNANVRHFATPPRSAGGQRPQGRPAAAEDGPGAATADAACLRLSGAGPPESPPDEPHPVRHRRLLEQTAQRHFISPARFFTHILPDPAASRADQIAAWQAGAQPGLQRLDTHLAARSFVLGAQCSVADIAVYGSTHLAPEGGIALAPYPAVQDWIVRVQRALDIPDLHVLLPA